MFPHSLRRGFTFVELTLVVTIVALLAVIAIPNFLEARVRSAVSRSKSDLALVKMGIEAYRLENRAYPLNSTPGVASTTDLVVLTTPIAYMPNLPPDIFTTANAGRGRVDHPPPKIPPASFHYLNAHQINGEAGLKYANEGSQLFRGYVAVLLWGIGPGTPYPAPPDKNPTKISADGVAELIPYDPTNGTTSPGDIYSPVP